MVPGVVLVTAVPLLSKVPGWHDAASLLTYNGVAGKTYNASKFVAADKRTFAMAEEGLSIASHPSYVVHTPAGNMLVTGDSFGTGSGRGWANLFDTSATLKWAWQSNATEFDAVLGATALPDETVILGGTRSVAGRWELLLVAIRPDGKEMWTTTLAPRSPRRSDCARDATASNCFGVIYWVDVDSEKKLLLIGGVVDFPHDQGTILWKSGGGQPDEGGVPFVAAIPFEKLATAPRNVQTVHYFDDAPGFTTVVSLRAEPGRGLVALLPLNPFGGAVARLTYDEAGELRQEWLSSLSLKHQVTDIAIVGQPAAATGYAVTATVNPGAKVEALTHDGRSKWVRSFDINATFPPEMTPKGRRNWCQECWSIASSGDEVVLSCGVAELQPGDFNCDHGLWRSLLVRLSPEQPTDASYHLFGKLEENFAIEYASIGASGEMLCAIDSDSGAAVVRFVKDE